MVSDDVADILSWSFYTFLPLCELRRFPVVPAWREFYFPF